MSSGAAAAARTDTWTEKQACPCAISSSAMRRGGLFWAKADSPVGRSSGIGPVRIAAGCVRSVLDL